jgi:hypothetical protein
MKAGRSVLGPNHLAAAARQWPLPFKLFLLHFPTTPSKAIRIDPQGNRIWNLSLKDRYISTRTIQIGIAIAIEIE